jgi:hypothetical protein
MFEVCHHEGPLVARATLEDVDRSRKSSCLSSKQWVPSNQPDGQSGHIGIVRPSLDPSFFIAMLMRETSPMRKMMAVRKPKMTGTVKKSDRADMLAPLRE